MRALARLPNLRLVFLLRASTHSEQQPQPHNNIEEKQLKMIDRIHGKLIEKTLSGVVIDVGGVGFALTVTIGTYERLSKIGEMVTLITYLHVREDILDLYGFSSSAERDLFVTLLKISGVGPKVALAILSRFGPDELTRVVAYGNVKLLSTVSGIGKRTAEKLLVDLKTRLKVRREDVLDYTGGEVSATSEAIRALEVLGFPIAKADDAIRIARKKLGPDAAVEDLVKLALKG